MSREEHNRIKALEIEVKKLSRALEKEHVLAERNRANEESKRLLSEIVLAERSRLEHNMSLMLHHSSNILIFFDASGIIDFCADLFLAFKGFPPSFGLIKGKSLRELTEDFLPAAFIDGVERLLDTGCFDDADQTCVGTAAHETRFRAFSHIEQEVRDYTASAVLLTDTNGEKSGLLIQLYDTTENMQARREAEHANRAKSDFLATVSHEIRTPLNAIIGLTDMLSKTHTDEKQQGYLSKIRSSSIAMLDLINDILDFSKIEADKLVLVDEYFDLRLLLEHLRAMFEVMMEQKGLGFVVDLDPHLPEIVYGDEKRIRQVLINVLDNAYKYTESGTVTFSVTASGDNIVRFDITDTGIGIRNEDFGKLFVEFEQLDTVRNKHVAGTGLGLAITKRLIEMMRGRIEVQSKYGIGSTISALLPLKRGVRDDLPPVTEQALKFTAPTARVLVVDDVEVNIEIAAFLLEAYEVVVEKADNGLEAVQLASEYKYDLILMDHMMPVMDGIEATRLIRQLPGDAGRVPIVAFTANAIQGIESVFLEAGLNGFISKPLDTKQLSQALYEFLPDKLIVE